MGSIGLDQCNGKLMEDLKTMKTCGNSGFSPKIVKIFYSLFIGQVQYNTTLQKHTNIILKSTIFCYPHEVSL